MSYCVANSVVSVGATALVGLLYGVADFVTAFISRRWTYLSSRNARALGATGMEYTPGWAVAWHFIPVATIWKPYLAMSELFRASHPEFTGQDWPLAAGPSILPVWWLFWLGSSFVDNVVFRLWWRGDGTADNLVTLSWVSLISSALEVPLGVMALAVVFTLQNWQVAKYRKITEATVPAAAAVE